MRFTAEMLHSVGLGSHVTATPSEKKVLTLRTLPAMTKMDSFMSLTDRYRHLPKLKLVGQFQ